MSVDVDGFEVAERPEPERFLRWVCPVAECPARISGGESAVRFGAEAHGLTDHPAP